MKGKSGYQATRTRSNTAYLPIEKRRLNGVTTEHEENIKAAILDGLVTYKGCENQISTAMRIPAEVIASDAALLMSFNQAIDAVLPI